VTLTAGTKAGDCLTIIERDVRFFNTFHELFGSDHFPIHINLFDNENSSKSYNVPRYQLETANWPVFTSLTEIFHNKRPPSNQINQEAANIIKIIHQSASTAIPQSNPVFNKKKPSLGGTHPSNYLEPKKPIVVLAKKKYNSREHHTVKEKQGFV